MSKYPGPTIKHATTINARGNIEATAMAVHKSVNLVSEISLGTHLPGVIIFVHGVNSEGEWYDVAEKSLCDGLNQRLGLTGSDYQLVANEYIKDRVLLPGATTYLKKANNSPVIRFFWGYRAPDDQLDRYLVPLRNRQGESYQQQRVDKQLTPEQIKAKGPYFWGGGPFQNASTNLNQLWSEYGFNERIINEIISLQWFNPEDDRLLKDAPARNYYAHATWRLAMLIARIRQDYPKDTITIISHSKGTMIASAAALMSPPDALFLMNSPYRLFDIMADGPSLHDSERVTDEARIETFKNVVEAVATNQHKLTDYYKQRISLGQSLTGAAWQLDVTTHQGVDGSIIPERDNYGRTYIYCNAHDRVMGSMALTSIGWQGLPNDRQGNPHPLLTQCQGKLYQRIMARSLICGGAPNSQTPFGKLPDMYKIIEIPDNIENPNLKSIEYQAKSFWDDMRYAVELDSIVYAVNPLFLLKKEFMPIWQTPPIWQTLNINAEQVPNPLTAEEMTAFDENVRDKDKDKNEGETHGPGWGQKTKTIDEQGNVTDVRDNDNNYPYYLPLYQLDRSKGQTPYRVHILSKLPAGVESHPMAEQQRAANRSKGILGIENGWIVWNEDYSQARYGIKNQPKSPPSLLYYGYLEFDRSRINEHKTQVDQSLKGYVSRPTDHSTLPQSTTFMSRVAAYDLPIGFGYSLAANGIKDQLIAQADWTLPYSDPYMETGVLAHQASTDELQAYFYQQTLLSPQMPAGINCETLSNK